MRPDTCKIFHLATAGDIEGMKMMFARGLASPNDVAYTFGYSLLHVGLMPITIESQVLISIVCRGLGAR